MSAQSVHSRAGVGVHQVGRPGNLIYVVIDDRGAFDLIDLPELKTDNPRVRVKAVKEGQIQVFFQHWNKEA